MLHGAVPRAQHYGHGKCVQASAEQLHRQLDGNPTSDLRRFASMCRSASRAGSGVGEEPPPLPSSCSPLAVFRPFSRLLWRLRCSGGRVTGKVRVVRGLRKPPLLVETEYVCNGTPCNGQIQGRRLLAYEKTSKNKRYTQGGNHALQVEYKRPRDVYDRVSIQGRSGVGTKRSKEKHRTTNPAEYLNMSTRAPLFRRRL